MKVLFAVLSISILLIGCKPKPEDYVGKATVHINAKNFALAIEEYDKLIADHPDSPQAEEAAFAIASLYHNDMRDFRKAVDAYARFAEKYPKAERAPTALFLVGFICNDELKDLDRAKKAYEKFLELYPQHEMADDAQFELKNLGKSPEELLPPIQETQTTAAQTPKGKSTKKN
jgi:TolA-binding protein